MASAGLAAAAGGILAAGAGALAYGMAEAQAFTVRRVEVPVLPAGEAPLRVLHVSDIHLMPYQRRKLAFVAALADLEPHLVVNTGDNISSPESIGLLARAWDDLLRVPGVFVFGSNDYSLPRFRNPLRYLVGPSGNRQAPPASLPVGELRAMLSSHGWVDLNHRRVRLEVDGRVIEARGTDDAHLNRDDYPAVAGPADTAVDLAIAVTHAPYLRLLDAMTADGAQLIFAGHTHGGQVCVPGVGALVTNCDLDTGRVKGLSRHAAAGRSAWLHVSAGIGTSPYAPYRVACRPEATLLTLVARA